MKIFWTLAGTISLLFGVGAHGPTENPPGGWKQYSYMSDGFGISSPQVPKLTSADNYKQYLVYWNEETNDVITVSFSLKLVDCSAWNQWAKNLDGNVIRIIMVSGNPALESRGNRNALQAGYTLDQCMNGRVYRFAAGWRKGKPKPPIVDKVLKSFHVLRGKS